MTVTWRIKLDFKMKLLFNYIVFNSFFYLITAEIETAQTELPTRDIEVDKTVKNSFARLLKSIVNVNEQRVDVLKKLSKLQEFDVTKSNLRSVDESPLDFTPDNFEDGDGKILVIIVDQDRSLRTNNDKISQPKDDKESLETSQSTETSDDDDEEDTNYIKDIPEEDNLRLLNIDKEQVEMLRKSWRSSCDRRAARVCKKACMNAYKNVCSAYRCSRRMKRAFKKECKTSCKAKFRSDSQNYSDTE